MSQERLENLFTKCDRRGTGFIDSQAFRELCHSFEIEGEDADSIFYDLDHDGDKKISFEDFAHGFRDFLTPGTRRGSCQLGLSPFVSPSEPYKAFPGHQIPSTPDLEHKYTKKFGNNNCEVIQEELPSLRMNGISTFHNKAKNSVQQTTNKDNNAKYITKNAPNIDVETRQRDMEVKHKAAEGAWIQLTKNVRQDDVNKMLEGSGDKLVSLYEELQTNEASPHLLSQYEEVMSALMSDVKKIDESKRNMEEKIKKERESHTTHLKNMEAELDAQVARIEKQEREKARLETEFEKRELQDKLETELDELKAQLKLFQKVDSWINKEKDEQHTIEAQKRLDKAFNENRHLKMSLGDTQTNIALVKAELNQMRSQYDTKCNELSSEREQRMEYLYEVDNLGRQLDLLREANEKLQDNNDGLREVVDFNNIRSPRPSMGKRSPIMNVDDFYTVESAAEILNRGMKKKRNPRFRYTNGNLTPSAYDSDSLRSRESEHRPRVDMQFGLKRFIDDLDSGNSTLPADDNGYEFSPELDEETTDAIRMLDSVVMNQESPYEDEMDSIPFVPTPRARKNIPPHVAPRRRQTVAFETDRSLTEVSDGEAVEENFEKFRIEVRDHAASRLSNDNEEPTSITLNVRRSLSFNGKEVAVVPNSDLAGRYLTGTRKVYDPNQNTNSLSTSEESSENAKPVPAPRTASLIRRPSSAGIKFKKEILSVRDLDPTGPPDRTYKVVFAGDAAVGKTSFINRLTKGYFMDNLSSTLGVDFQVKTFRVDERNIALQLWDTAGQERFRSVTKSYFRRADGVMLLYDVTNERSFVAVRDWIEAVDDVSEKRVPIMLCGNKTDLRQEAMLRNQRVISAEKGEKLARHHQAIFLETSSKDGSNVIEALVNLSRDMCSAEDTELQTSALKLRGDDHQITKKSTCCSKS